jgi:hypothetical protein
VLSSTLFNSRDKCVIGKSKKKFKVKIKCNENTILKRAKDGVLNRAQENVNGSAIYTMDADIIISVTLVLNRKTLCPSLLAAICVDKVSRLFVTLKGETRRLFHFVLVTFVHC